MIKRIVQTAVITSLRPYVSRELPGWGRLYGAIADYRHDALWAGAGVYKVRNRLTGHVTEQDLSKWADRQTYFLGRWHDLEMQSFIKSVANPADTIVDIGANRGEFALFASSLVPQGRVIAFEPNPICADTLSRDIDRNEITNIDLRRVGLSDSDGSLSLSVPDHNSGEANFRPNGSGNAMTVPIRIGDNELSGEKPAVIKIDVEGFEMNVLRGLARTISESRPVVITEIIREHLSVCGSSPEEVLDFFSSRGYTGYTLALEKIHGAYKHALHKLDFSRSIDAVWMPN